MIRITDKTLKDLEFQTVLQQLSELCITEKGGQDSLSITPISDQEKLLHELYKVNEYKSSYLQDTRIPNHGYDTVDKELKLLAIENTFLEASGLQKVVSLNGTLNIHLKFFEKRKELYPELALFASKFTYTNDIIQLIELIIDRFGEVKSNASQVLSNIRKQLAFVNSQLNGSFGRDLSKYATSGYLDEIRETVIDNRRVLAVKAMYRRKVKGAVMGLSLIHIPSPRDA